MMKKLKNEKGLTLVELLAVIVILAIVGAIAFVMIGNVMDNAKKDAHIANAQQLIASAKLHDAQGGEFEENTITGEELHEGELIDILINPWSKEKYEDPQGTVTKEGPVYTVTLKAQESSCEIDSTSEEDL